MASLLNQAPRSLLSAFFLAIPQHVGSTSIRIHAPYIVNPESEPLDHRGSPFALPLQGRQSRAFVSLRMCVRVLAPTCPYVCVCSVSVSVYMMDVECVCVGVWYMQYVCDGAYVYV